MPKIAERIDVWRVENPDNQLGPFRSHDDSDSNSALNYEMQEYTRMPNPWVDHLSMPVNSKSYYFAFPDYETCRSFWTVNTVYHLMEKGFMLVKYNALKSKVRKGESGLQVIFHLPTAVRTEVKLLSILMED